ncbi:MAG TPA: hypothetical protein VE967_19845 [Gemmatimonadaceae bacterium]|nr:hypothetical protein [Gemmatimonadaceae bacterium]
MKPLGIVLLVLGIVGLALGGFTYTKKTHDAHLGPIDLSVKEKKTVNVPLWAGIAAVVIGAGILVAPAKKL